MPFSLAFIVSVIRSSLGEQAGSLQAASSLQVGPRGSWLLSDLWVPCTFLSQVNILGGTLKCLNFRLKINKPSIS